jgi:uncharacterized protein (DUF488 family)
MRIWTAGYEGQSLSGFLNRLTGEGVSLVVDVREMPLSRKPGFSKSAMAAALTGVGIAYRHLRELGCPKRIRDRFREDHDWTRYTRSYLAHLKTQDAALVELSRLASESSVALLCYEADPAQCHRSCVARTVAAALRAEVVHILRDEVSREKGHAVAA